jgi:hypothetical protein
MNQDPQTNSIECTICLTNTTEIITFSCGHSCCKQCWKGIVKAANDNFKVNEIKCFVLSCKKPISNCEALASQISDKDITNRYQYLSKKQQILSDKNKYICPNKECYKILDVKNQKKTKKKYLKNQKKQESTKAGDNPKNLQDLDYSFLICDDCDQIFCKICEVFHEPGKATCKNSKELSSETIIKVTQTKT